MHKSGNISEKKTNMKFILNFSPMFSTIICHFLSFDIDITSLKHSETFISNI